MQAPNEFRPSPGMAYELAPSLRRVLASNPSQMVTTQVVLRLIRFSVSNNLGSCIWYERCDLLRRCY